MARRSLRPHLNQIRGWVRQGRTDAWIAHQLEVTVQQIETFKRENELAPAEAENGEAPTRRLRRRDRPARRGRRAHRRRARGGRGAQGRGGAPARPRRTRAAPRPARPSDDDDDARRSPRRAAAAAAAGAAARRAGAGALEGTFDHGEEGYGLWLDPAVADNPVYAEHWAGHRPVEVTIEEDQIVIRRAGDDADDD